MVMEAVAATAFPSRVNIETTNACNLKCPMCARTTQMTREVGHMTFDLFRKIADELGDHDIERVYLHIFGEPLMHPEIFEFIDYIKQYPRLKSVALSTNVTVLDERKAHALAESPLDSVALAIDAATSDAYAATRGANFDHVVRNVTRFLELRAKSGSNIQVDIQMIPMLLNQSDIEAFQEQWAPYLGDGVQVFLKPFTDFAGQVDDVGLAGDDAERFAPVQFVSRGRASRKPCSFLWEEASIHAHGGVVACCIDVNGLLHLGDMSTQSLAEVWNGKPMQELRAAHTAGEFARYPLCNGCFMTCE